jgi:hypothetical protein
MDYVSPLIGPILGMIGVVVGSLLNEFIRRRRRVEEYSSIIFEKRLKAYEELMTLIHRGSDLAREAIDNADLSHSERHDLISDAVGQIAEFVDRNSLYINEELGAHCVALFMGVEDVRDSPEATREDLALAYYANLRETFRMIKEDSGLTEINKLLRSINRPRITSPVIEAIREVRRDKKLGASE